MPVSPPFPRLPSLNALRAFEAAARLGGFAQAAEELQVTAGAVAAQIKALEAELGADLFARHARGVRLTALGERALPRFVSAFDELTAAVRDLRSDAAPRKVHIAALPALAQLWLAPRLPKLRARFPDIDISVTATEAPPNLKRVPFDLCLFYEQPDTRGKTPIASDALLPVCSPDVAKTLRCPKDLVHAVCLSDTAWADDWRIWAAETCPEIGLVPKGPVFSLYALAVEEALNGAGILMAHSALVADHLHSGALVAPFPMEVPLPNMISSWSLPGGRGNRIVAQVAEELGRLSQSRTRGPDAAWVDGRD